MARTETNPMRCKLVIKEPQENPNEKYYPIRQIGAGMSSKVFLVLNVVTNVRHAIKLIRFDQKFKDRDQQIKEYKREVEAMCRSSLENVLDVVEVFNYENVIGLVLPHCAGSLDDILSFNNFHLDEIAVACITKQLLAGLHSLHENNVIHRDIKTSNILVDFRGTCKIADFNLSSVLEESFQMANTVCGTPYYIAPEICMNLSYHTKADIWSLGVLIYILLVGCVPNELKNKNPTEVMAILVRPDCTRLFRLPGRRSPTERPCNDPAINPYATQYGVNWSPEINNFLSLCFKHAPAERASARDLYFHPWITQMVPANPPKDQNGSVTAPSAPLDEQRSARMVVRTLVKRIPSHVDEKATNLPPYVQPMFEKRVNIFPSSAPFSQAVLVRSAQMTLPVLFGQHRFLQPTPERAMADNALLQSARIKGLISLSEEEYAAKCRSFRADYELVTKHYGKSHEKQLYLNSIWETALYSLSLLSLFEEEDVISARPALALQPPAVPENSPTAMGMGMGDGSMNMAQQQLHQQQLQQQAQAQAQAQQRAGGMVDVDQGTNAGWVNASHSSTALSLPLPNVTSTQSFSRMVNQTPNQ